MKDIAVITGASSGMGKEFALTLKDHGLFDELWVISRDQKELETLRNKVPFPLKVIPLDLEKMESYETYKSLLEKEKPNVKLLINCSGFGKFDKTTDISFTDNIGMINLNCRGLTSMTILSIPYMKPGASIINIASVAAYQPVPFINIYAASKAYVLSFSRSLNRELKSDGIHVMAVSPFWTNTNFFKRAVDSSKPPVIKKYVAMYQPEDIVKRAWRDLRHQKEVSKYGFIARAQVGLCKILPHKMIMNIWINQQKLK